MSANVQQHHFILFAFILLQLVVLIASELETLNDDDNNSKEEDDPDGSSDELRTGAIVGIVIGVLAILVAIPILLCLCCGWCCFKRKEPKIIGVTPSASATLRRQHMNKATPEPTAPELVTGQDDNKTNSTPNRRDSQFDSDQDFTPYPLNDNLGTLYYNLGYEPPPPYSFGEDGNANHSDEAWGTRNEDLGSGSTRHSEVNIDERIRASRLGPSLIKGGHLG